MQLKLVHREVNTLAWQWCCLLAAVPWLLHAETRPQAGWLAAVLVLAQQAVRTLDPEERRRRFDLDVTWPAFGLLVTAAYSTSVSRVPAVSLSQFYLLLFQLGLFTATVSSLRRPGMSRLPRLWYAVVLYTIAGTAVAIVLFLFAYVRPYHPELIAAINRVRPAISPEMRTWLGLRFIHPNIAAATLLWFLPVCTALVLIRPWRGAEARLAPRLLQRLGTAQLRVVLLSLSWSALVLISFVLLWTLSRGGYFAAALSIACLIAYRWSRLRPILAVALGMTAFIALGALAMYHGWLSPAGGVGSVINWLDQWTELHRNWTAMQSLQERSDIWSRTVRLILARPWTGYGPLAWIVYAAFLGFPVPDHVHNLFLQTALDMGVPGLAFFLAILGVAARRLYAGLRGMRGTRHEAIVLGLGGALLAYLIWSLTDFRGWGKGPAFFWVLLGMVVSLPDSVEVRTASAATERPELEPVAEVPTGTRPEAGAERIHI